TNTDQIKYTNLASVNLAATGGQTPSLASVISNLQLRLPAGTNSATLADDGTASNGISQISGATFATTQFGNVPLTINQVAGATDSLTLNAAGDFTNSLNLGATTVAPLLPGT